MTGAPRRSISGSAVAATAMLVASVVLACLTILVGTEKDPNRLAASLLQAITLVFGTVGSFVFGKLSTTAAARELVRPHARSAFRRVRNLYAALGRQRDEIDTQITRLDSLRETTQPSLVAFEHAQGSMSVLRSMVVEQISTVDDALEDWRDLVPEEVAEIERQARSRGESDV